MNDRPACARCAYETSTRPQRRVSLAVAFLGLAWGGGLWAVRRYHLLEETPITIVLGALAALIIAVLIGATARDPARPDVERRDPDEADGPAEGDFTAATPYRAYARRALLAVSPRLSGKVTALIVLGSLAASAILLPVSLRLPLWIEAEIVLAAWWIIVAAALIVLLYRGFRLRDDVVYFLPWDRPAPEAASTSRAPPGPPPPKKASRLSGFDIADGCSGVDGCSVFEAEGCLGALAVAAALAIAAGAAWILVELAAPLTFLLMYWLFMRAVGRVANDRHGCEGRLINAIGWGALWATVYVLPLAAFTWALHALRR